MNFEPVIGIEIHVELKTKSKMFSSGPVTFGNMPNTETVLFDWAFPGTMPVVNKEAVKYGIKIANALNMSVSKTLYFDRKNYFYSDLPKGYQITQQDHPIGYEGFLEIETSNGKRKIGIERPHSHRSTYIAVRPPHPCSAGCFFCSRPSIFSPVSFCSVFIFHGLYPLSYYIAIFALFQAIHAVLMHLPFCYA